MYSFTQHNVHPKCMTFFCGTQKNYFKNIGNLKTEVISNFKTSETFLRISFLFQRVCEPLGKTPPPIHATLFFSFHIHYQSKENTKKCLKIVMFEITCVDINIIVQKN